MRLLSAVLDLIASCTAALAVDFRLTLGLAKGLLEANIENGAGSAFSIHCPTGSENKTPGMFITVARIKPQVKDTATAQMIVDGKNQPPFSMAASSSPTDARTIGISNSSSTHWPRANSLCRRIPEVSDPGNVLPPRRPKNAWNCKEDDHPECDDGT